MLTQVEPGMLRQLKPGTSTQAGSTQAGSTQAGSTQAGMQTMIGFRFLLPHPERGWHPDRGRHPAEAPTLVGSPGESLPGPARPGSGGAGKW